MALIQSPSQVNKTTCTIIANYQGMIGFYYPEYFGKKWAIIIRSKFAGRFWSKKCKDQLDKDLRMVFESMNVPESFGLKNIRKNSLIFKSRNCPLLGFYEVKAILNVKTLKELI